MRSAALLSVLLLGVLAIAARAGDRIGDDEDVRRYGLRNGLEVVVVDPSPAPVPGGDGAVQLWLMVDAGATDERDSERGVSQIAAALLRHGVGGFDEETIGSMLISEGERDRYGERARGVQVHFDQTIFSGHAPAGDADAIGELLAYYAAVLDPGGWDTSEERFETHRGWLRKRVDQVLDPMMMARQRWLLRLFGDGPVGTRLDLPELGEIDALTRDDLRAYADRAFRASRATLIVLGDAGEIDEAIAKTLGKLPTRPEGPRADLMEGLGGETVIFEHEPGWDLHQAVLVWDNAMGEDLRSDSSVRAGIIERVATELVRRRIERLGIAQLGRDTEIGVDRFELGNSVQLTQCVVQREGTDEQAWSGSIELLLTECERLARHGAGRDEIVQARGALLAEWHRDAEAWDATGPRERVGEMVWMVKTDRPVLGAVRWDAIATRMMSTISDAEINAAIREMMDLGRARVLVSVGGETPGVEDPQARLEAIVDRARSRELAALDPSWMRTLGGELIDDSRFDGEVTRVTQHGASGTWGATLGNGIRVWARSVGDDGRIELAAMVSGPMFSDGTLSEAEIDAALLAWEEPSTERRDAGWLALYQENHDLRVRARRVVGGARISIEGDRANAEAAIELLYALLDRPMIDAGAYQRWAEGEPERLGKDDPLDRALAMMYRPEMLEREGIAVSLDDAQRALTRIVQNGQIEVAIAGDLDAADALERAGEVLGMLTRREPAKQIKPMPNAQRTFEEGLARVRGEHPGVVLGMRGGELSELRSLRAIIMASMVLDGALQREAKSRGYAETDLDTHVVMSDALADRWALVVRIRGGSVGACEDLARAELERIASEGIDAQELGTTRERLVGSIDRYFDRAGYWSTRLSTLGAHGRTVDDLWTIREGYSTISADEATAALRSALGSGDWFRVEIEPRAK